MIKYISFSSDFYKGRKATQQRHQRQKNVNLNYTFIKAVSNSSVYKDTYELLYKFIYSTATFTFFADVG